MSTPLSTPIDVTSDPNWWRQAVVYQIYPRSFADANGDGIGDLQGITSRVPYLASLGIDAVWLSPFYPSALADGGYDVDDYRDVDPRLGTLADFDEMIGALHAAGLKLIVDIVPNHTSNRHDWFRRGAGRRRRARPARDRYIFRDGKGPDGVAAAVGLAVGVRRIGLGAGPGRSVVPAPVRQGTAGPELGQPRGARRLPDHAAVLGRPRRRRLPGRRRPPPGQGPQPSRSRTGRRSTWRHLPHGSHPFEDRDEVHEIYAEWRQVFNEYDPPRTAVAEAWVHASRRARYASPEGLGQAFNFDLLQSDFDADELPPDHHPQPRPRPSSPGRRPPGCSPTTTSSGTPPATACRRPPTAATRTGKAWLLSDGTTPELDVELGLRRAPRRHPADAGAARIRLPLPG